MAPAGQERLGQSWHDFGCGHVYGVWIAARWLRALMKVRGRFGPNQWHALQGAPVRTGCPLRYSRHLPSSHDALAFSVGVCPLSMSGGLRRTEFCPVLHQRIRRSRHAVGQGNRGLLGFLALDDLPQPIFPSFTPPADTDLRIGAEIEQSAQI